MQRGDICIWRLHKRAERNHRSLQGELLVIIEEAAREQRKMTPEEILAEVRRLGVSTPSNSVEIIRAMRDAGS